MITVRNDALGPVTLPDGVTLLPGHIALVSETLFASYREHPVTAAWIAAGALRVGRDDGKPVAVMPVEPDAVDDAPRRKRTRIEG